MALLLACSPAEDAPRFSSHPDSSILLITVDALRPDRLGCYGYERSQTPAVDALAERAIRFTAAYTTAPLTAVAHASLMTGRYPIHHGVRDDGVYPLDEDALTLAEHLDHAGVTTVGVVGSAALSSSFGFDQGFVRFDDEIDGSTTRWPTLFGGAPTLAFERPADAVVDAAIRRLDEVKEERFFLWAHFSDCTTPYDAPGVATPVPSDDLGDVVVQAPQGSYLSSLSFLSDAYDEEVSYVDRAIGRLLDAVPSGTVVVLAGSHGESLGEHGVVGHGLQLYEESIRVPLLIALPGGRAQTVGRMTSLVDLMPSILEIAAVEPLRETDGRSVSTPIDDRVVYAETHRPLETGQGTAAMVVRSQSWKARFGAGNVVTSLFDLEGDPAERDNRLSEERDEARRLRGLLRNHPATNATQTNEDGVDPEIEAQLRALGYVGGSDGGGDAEWWSSFRQGVRALHRRDATRARTFLAPLLETNVRSSWVRMRLAESHRMDEGWAEMIELLENEPAADPIVSFTLAEAAGRLGRREAESRRLRETIAGAPRFLDARIRLATRLVESGRDEEAASLREEARNLSPGDLRLPLLEALFTQRER